MLARSSRREFLVGAAGGIAALTLPGRAWSSLARLGASATGAASYVTASFKPPTLSVTTLNSPAPGYVFATTLNGPGDRGPVIVDDHGRVVWFRKTKDVAINFRRQVYRGKPVLTWWEGTISKVGVGQGEGVILDSSYREIARVRAGNGQQADVHELLLTPQGTALITAYASVVADLSSVGGSASGTVLDSIVQEVDVASGAVLFEWHSLDHVGLDESYATVGTEWDYFHVNSIDVDADGNLIVSARNTSAVYKLDRRSGQVLWRLGGRKSDFTLGAGVPFMYQHDARTHADGTMTIFDDGPSPSADQSRAIRLRIDEAGRRADLVEQFERPDPTVTFAMGNAQVLADGHLMVGWGTMPYITEFDASGAVTFDAKFDGGAWNYRAFRDVWVGRPHTLPLIAVRHHSGPRPTLYASWNGSTETAYWQILAGDRRSDLQPLKTIAKAGFETAVPFAAGSRYVAVRALDAAHHPLATSSSVRV